MTELLHFFLYIPLIFCIFSCSPGDSRVSQMISHPAESDRGKWLLKIGKYTVYEGDFIQEYLLPLKYMGYSDKQLRSIQNDLERKQQFIRQVEDEYLVLLLAEKEGVFGEKDFKYYSRLKLREAVEDYYITTRLRDRISVTDEEIVRYYNTHKHRFNDILDQATRWQIHKYLEDMKIQELLERKIGKFREKSRIRFNKKTRIFSKDAF